MPKLLIYLSFMLLLSACASEETVTETPSEESLEQEAQMPQEEETEEVVAKEPEESPVETNDTAFETTETDPLAEYSAEEIEYARVWLNFGPHPNADPVNYEILPAGTAIIPEVEGSATYSDEVVQLSGNHRTDGMVTYSSNGDGTITLYNVPYSWDVNAEVEDEVYIKESEKVLESTETQYVEPLEDEAVIELIEKLEPVVE